MLTAEYVPCFHKLYKSTCALCAQPQLQLPRRVCPGEGKVCFRTLCRPDPGGGDRRFKIYEHCRLTWKLCPNRLPCIPALRQSLRRQGSLWSIFVSFLVIKVLRAIHLDWNTAVFYILISPATMFRWWISEIFGTYGIVRTLESTGSWNCS